MSMYKRDELEIEAEKIADILITVDHRLRGEFLMLVGECLDMKTQYYTSHAIKEAARAYGMKGVEK